jgi:hypothetical protein
MPLIKKHFCHVLELPSFRIRINFRSNKDDNQDIAKNIYNAQWGGCRGKNPYRYLQSYDLEMKSHIEYLWPIVH